MDLGLNGRTAIVTGASRGIGLAVTRGLVAEGVHVTAGARKSSAELGELAGTGMVRVVEADLSGPGGPSTLVAAAGDRIDILVNNVGGAPARTGGFLSITDEDWLATLNLNLLAAVRMTRAVVPAMLTAGHGAIITVCSVNAKLPDPAVLDYSAAKAGLASFCKACPRNSARTASASTPSAPAPWPPTCGSAPAESPRPSATPPAPPPRTSSAAPPARWSPAASPSLLRSPT
jgi:NAD(P)-dependent dehydrogenase (short-subunit alcohol dehydrogenase family)